MPVVDCACCCSAAQQRRHDGQTAKVVGDGSIPDLSSAQCSSARATMSALVSEHVQAYSCKHIRTFPPPHLSGPLGDGGFPTLPSTQGAGGRENAGGDDADTEPQRHTNGWPNDHGCSTSVHNAAAVKETHGCARRDAQAGSSSGSSGSSSIIATPAASGAQHELLQAPRSGNFDRLVLHPSMFTHHRTRSYLGALLELLRPANQASGL